MKYRVFLSAIPIPLAVLAVGCATALAIDDPIAQPEEDQLGMGIQFAKDATFDDWVFNGKSDRFATEIEALFRQRVEEIRQKFSLAESHQTKLKLAAQGDLQHYYDQVDDLRRRFDETMKDNNETGQHSVTSDWHLVREEAEQLRIRHKSLFNRSSLVWKVASKLKSAEDLTRRRQSISFVVREIADSVDLQSEQQQAIAELLTKELRTSKVPKEYDVLLVCYLCSQLPADTLRAFFSDEQWPRVQQVLNGYQQYRDLLAQHRLISVERATVAGTPARSRYQRRNGPASALFPDNSLTPLVTAKQDRP